MLMPMGDRSRLRQACAARPSRPTAWRGRACRRPPAPPSAAGRRDRARACAARSSARSRRRHRRRRGPAALSAEASRSACRADKLVLHRQRRLRRPLALARQLVRRDRQPRQRQPLAQPEIEAGRRLDAHAVGARRQHEIARRRQGFEGGRAARDARSVRPSPRRPPRVRRVPRSRPRRSASAGRSPSAATAAASCSVAAMASIGCGRRRSAHCTVRVRKRCEATSMRICASALSARIERFDVAPQVAQLPGVAHDGEGAGDGRGRRAGAAGHVAHEGRAAAIDQRVHDLQRRDLAAQAMGADRRLVLLAAAPSGSSAAARLRAAGRRAGRSRGSRR